MKMEIKILYINLDYSKKRNIFLFFYIFNNNL